MRTTPPRKALIILITLLIGFLSGAAATSYVLLRYSYLIGFERTSQTSRSSLRTPKRIPQVPFQPQQNVSIEDLAPEITPQTETQMNVWIPDQTVQTIPQTETQQLTTEQPNPTSPPNQQIQRQPNVIPNPQDFSSATAAGVPANHGAVRPVVPESPAVVMVAIIELRQRNLLLPLSGLKRQDLVDSFSEARGNHVHEAIDILAPRNTPVLAVEDGSIARFWNSVPGGITIYQFDPEKKYEYYYAHLESYAEGLKEGDQVRRGQVIGYVGTSGNAPKGTPHLHFTIFKLTESKHWWEGTPVNPYLVFSSPQRP